MKKDRFEKYYQAGPHFRIENPNPAWAKKRGITWDRGDCAIRALANATGCTWLDAFDYLTAKARAEYNVVNDNGGFRRWLIEGGAVWTGCKAEKGKDRITVEDFAKKHPHGRYVIQIRHHFTACVDGVVLDAWNPAEDYIIGFYEMTKFNL